MSHQNDPQPSRRQALKTLGVLGAAVTLDGASAVAASPVSEPTSGDFRHDLRQKIEQTTLADTHEHLADEQDRLANKYIACDDWAFIFSHYIDSDIRSSGIPLADFQKLTSRDVDPDAKWPLLAPYWPAVKNTGYGRAVRVVLKQLYGIDELNDQTAKGLQKAYEATRKPGFYHHILKDLAKIESCQVNCITGAPFGESHDPTFMLQDLGIVGMYMGPDVKKYATPTGIQPKDLADWHKVIQWWLDKYGPYAVAVKSQAAYMRGLDYEQVPAEKVEGIFKRRVVEQQPITADEKKMLQDHLFWYCVEQATKHHLPVKLHTGYYAGHNNMPLGRVAGNTGDATELCRKSPDTQFVFMHIAYPYWQQLIAVAKHYTNAHIDMCWAWIIDPAASVQFLKSYLMAAPSNKVLIFGGDYIPVECVLGHAQIARHGITQALAQLVDEEWLSPSDAFELVEPLMHGNARRIFQIEAKQRTLQSAPWA